jgi:hypothetical protein
LRFIKPLFQNDSVSKICKTLRYNVWTAAHRTVSLGFWKPKER